MGSAGSSRRPGRRHRCRRAVVVVVSAALVAVVPACSGGQETSSSATSSSAGDAAAPGASRLVDPAAFEQLIAENPGAPVLNVHVPYEGHIAGTTDFVPYDTIGTWGGGRSAARDQLVIMYCRSGTMSATAAETLAQMGYTNIVDLRGGMRAWTGSGRALLDEQPS